VPKYIKAQASLQAESLFLDTGSDSAIQPLVFTIDDGDVVRMIVSNLDFGAAITAWEIGGDDF